MKLSLVVPCYNEAENVQAFQNATIQAFDGCGYDFEIVFVDDGSKDATMYQLRKIFVEQKCPVKVVSFSRNFGKESGLYAGLEHADGEYICFIDADLQQDIEAIDLIVTHDDEIVDGLMNALEAYTGDADLSNLKLITSVGGRKQTLDKFDNTTLDVKFVTWFFAPSFIRECVDFTCENAMGVPFSGTAAEVDGIYLIPSFSIGNAGNTDQTFDSYRASEIFATRYSIDG